MLASLTNNPNNLTFKFLMWQICILHFKSNDAFLWCHSNLNDPGWGVFAVYAVRLQPLFVVSHTS